MNSLIDMPKIIKMLELNLPPFDIKLTKQNSDYLVFDPLRRKHIKLIPEEWVRQHFINYIISTLDYPTSLIANEIQINLNGLNKRCDTIVYNRDSTPLMIIEYKAPNIPITQEVFNQIARYNLVLRVNYLIVSNGLEHYCCYVDYENQTINYLPDIPHYEDITSTPLSSEKDS